MVHPAILVIGLLTKLPIKSLRLVISIIGTMAKGRAKLKTTWLNIRAFMGLTPNAIIIKAGVIVINLRILMGIVNPTKPFIMVCSAMVPTAEDDKPDANARSGGDWYFPNIVKSL